MSSSDSELIGRFAREGDDRAFAELVHRHLDLVHSAALRQCDGRAAVAEDIAQAVFTQLAAKARTLAGHPTLTGWLYSATRLAALEHRRAESRRLERERNFHRMNSLPSSAVPAAHAEPEWSQLQPVLDEAMHSLSEADREAVLLRFFEKRPLAEVGMRLGVSENAARMRVERALERLRTALAGRGITSTGAALGVALSNHAITAAPLGLAERIGAGAISGVATSAGVGVLASLWLWLASSAGKLAVGAALLATGVGVAVFHPSFGRNPPQPEVARPGISAGEAGIAAVDRDPTTPANASPAATPVAASEPAAASELSMNLQFIAEDSGQPVPSVGVGYRGWKGEAFTRRRFVGRRDGGAVVHVVDGTTRLELTTDVVGFASQRLIFEPAKGEPIPVALTVKLSRAERIAGRVESPEGQPVGGARVAWGTENRSIAGVKKTPNWIEWVETQTDAEGRWEIVQLAPELLPHLHGNAEHADFQPSAQVSTAQDSAALEQLKAGTHVFRLSPATTVRGIVVDAQGAPIPDAKLLIGRRGFVGSRTGVSAGDGVFAIPGCALGKTSVTAESPGYAAKTLPLDVAIDADPVRIQLERASAVRLRVVDGDGSPVNRAWVALDTFDRHPVDVPEASNALPVQADFHGYTDAEGRLEWREAPAGLHHFDVAAAGYMRTNHVAIPADGEEHVVPLAKALIVQGKVTDASTGRPIPRFRISFGWPQTLPTSQGATASAQFSSIDRFQPTFRSGEYRHVLSEEVLSGTDDRRCVLRFDAEGYTSVTSRPIGYGEGTVTLDVALEPAQAVTLQIEEPGGRPAGGARLGIPRPGAQLVLGAGTLSVEDGAPPGALFEANRQGELRMDAAGVADGPGPVLVVHPAGFALAPFETMKNAGTVRLAPWARIEGHFAKPGMRSVRIALPQFEISSLAVDIGTATDTQGAFVLAQVPFGRVRVEQNVVAVAGPGSSSSSAGPSVDLELQPGESQQVELAAGARITGRVVFPPGVDRPRPALWLASYHAVPPGMALPGGEMDLKAYRQWAANPANAGRTANLVPMPVSIGLDGQLSADGVPPGEFILSLDLAALATTPEASRRDGRNFSAFRRFAVPAERPDIEINLGEIPMKLSEP